MPKPLSVILFSASPYSRSLGLPENFALIKENKYIYIQKQNNNQKKSPKAGIKSFNPSNPTYVNTSPKHAMNTNRLPIDHPAKTSTLRIILSQQIQVHQATIKEKFN
ncbi:hypothetical protein [Pseudomonas chlororaphis]|uniref:hypothetical protein n=1 Tax=Pseudomonas chlororaphis TaxID=587753 RepID=UPI000F57B58A|nr:hypothetical protein [Pseudomonas chlororaphis]